MPTSNLRFSKVIKFWFSAVSASRERGLSCPLSEIAHRINGLLRESKHFVRLSEGHATRRQLRRCALTSSCDVAVVCQSGGQSGGGGAIAQQHPHEAISTPTRCGARTVHPSFHLALPRRRRARHAQPVHLGRVLVHFAAHDKVLPAKRLLALSAHVLSAVDSVGAVVRRPIPPAVRYLVLPATDGAATYLAARGERRDTVSAKGIRVRAALILANDSAPLIMARRHRVAPPLRLVAA